MPSTIIIAPLLTHHVLLAASHKEAGTLDQYLRSMIRHGPLNRLHNSDWDCQHVVPARVSELFAYRFSRHASVRVPELRLEVNKPVRDRDFANARAGRMGHLQASPEQPPHLFSRRQVRHPALQSSLHL